MSLYQQILTHKLSVRHTTVFLLAGRQHSILAVADTGDLSEDMPPESGAWDGS